MYLVDIERRAAKTGTFCLYAIGDLHCDLKTFDEARLKAYVQHIAKDPTAVAIFVGDAMDGRIPGRKHFDADAVRLSYLENLKGYVNHGLEHLEEYFKPLVKAKVPLVIISGNHDDYLEEIGLSAEIVKRLGGTAKYLGGEGFVRIRSGDSGKTKGFWTTVVHATHGSGGGKRPGGKVNTMQQTFEWVDADVVMAGHVHDGMIRIIPSYGVQRSETLALQIKKRVMYRAPSFVRRAVPGVVTYAGKKGFPSTDEGLQYVRLNPQEHNAIRIELEI